MTIHVRLFAALRETMGRDLVELSLGEGATPEDVWQALLRVQGGDALQPRRTNLAAAVNRKYAKFDAILRDGDEVVFIPPVSGG